MRDWANSWLKELWNVKMIKIKTEIVSSKLFRILDNRNLQLWKLNDFITMPQLCIKIIFYHLIYDKVGLCRLPPWHFLLDLRAQILLDPLKHIEIHQPSAAIFSKSFHKILHAKSYLTKMLVIQLSMVGIYSKNTVTLGQAMTNSLPLSGY